MLKNIVSHLLLQSRHGRPFTADLRLTPTGLAKPLVLFVHGFKGFKDWGHFNLLSRYFADQGFVFAKLNLSHNGTTPARPLDMADPEAFGHNNLSIELDDLGVFIDYFFRNPDKEINPERLFLIGHSRGGGLAVLKAAEDERIKALATWAAISDLPSRWTKEELAQWKENGVQYVVNARTGQQLPMRYQLMEDYERNEHRLNILNAATRITRPWLLLHGEADESVPVREAYQLKAAQPAARLALLSGANHTFGGMHPYPHPSLPPDAQKAADLTCAFFLELLT